MGLTDLFALGRRNLVAVTIVLFAFGGIAYSLHRAHPGYVENATVALETPGVNSAASRTSLITTAQVLALQISGVQGQLQLRQTGIADGFTVGVVNSFNLEEPSYRNAYLAVSVTGLNEAEAHSKFIRGLAVLRGNLSALQARFKLSTSDQVTLVILSDTDPLPGIGSNARVYGGVSFLALVTAYLVARALDGRVVRSGRLRTNESQVTE